MDTNYIFELRLKGGKHIIRLTKTAEFKWPHRSNFRLHEQGIESASKQFFFLNYKLTLLTRIKEEVIIEPGVPVDRTPSRERLIANIGKQIMDDQIREIRKLLEEARDKQLQNNNF